MAVVARVVLAYLSAVVSIYWTWRFFAIVTSRLLTDDRYLRGIYGHIGLLTWMIWIACSLLCYFCADAIENTTVRLLVIAIVGSTWGAILFVDVYYGWVGYDRYPGRIFW